MSKIKLDVIKPWIQDKITEILKIDDDVVVDFVYNQLDEKVVLLTFCFDGFLIFDVLVSGPQKDSNKFDWLFAWEECKRIYGRTMGPLNIGARKSYRNT